MSKKIVFSSGAIERNVLFYGSDSPTVNQCKKIEKEVSFFNYPNITLNIGSDINLEGRVDDLEGMNHFDNIILITSNEAQSDYLNS